MLTTDLPKARTNRAPHPRTAPAWPAQAEGPLALLLDMAGQAEEQDLDRVADLLRHAGGLWAADNHSALFRLTYVSHTRHQMGDEAPGNTTINTAILGIARARNAAADVTGALMASDRWFGQVLEGRLGAVEATFARILQDPRHNDVRVLRMEPVVTREFGLWAMAEAGDAPDALLGHAALMHRCLGGHSAPGLQATARDVLDMLHHLVDAA